MKKYILFITISLSCFNGLQAQDSLSNRKAKMYTEFPRCEVKLNGQYVLDYWQDFKYTSIGPARWKGKDWLIFAGVIGAGAALYAVDQPIYEWTQSTRTEGTETFAKYFEPFGNGITAMVASGALYIYGAALKKNKSKRVSLLMLESYLISGLYARIAKFTFGRWRPYNFPEGEEKHTIWNGPRFKDQKTSFYSGHSTSSYALATTFAFEFKDKPWVGILAYSIATASNVTRIHDRAHWASDVFIGSAIGYFTTRTILKRHTCEEPKLVLYPSSTMGSSGFGLRYIVD